jgi:FkbM family methyltransferase
MNAKGTDKMYYSQFGEDKILFELFNNKTSGICVEVGANNGVDDSTSLFFEKAGWKCILVEPNPYLCQNIRSVRNSPVYECAASNRSGTSTLYVVEGAERSDGLSTISTNKDDHDKIKSHGFKSRPVQVRTMTLDEILTDAKVSGNVDFITIDVEGHEHEAIEGFSIEKWKPAIILVEDNSYFENNTVTNYLKKFGYVRFQRTGVNDWYAHRTNKRLVNMRSRTRITWIVFKRRVKNRLLKIPLLVKLNDYFRK